MTSEKNLPTIDVLMKKLLAATTTIASGLAFAPLAFAQTINACPSGGFSVLCNLSPQKLLSNGINFIFVVAALLALVFLIIGGVKWLTSQGEKEAVNKARETIVASVVGLVIIFLSYLIVDFVLQLFVNVNLSNLTFPKLTQ